MGNTSGKSEQEEPSNYEIDPSLKEKAYALENEYIEKYCSPLTLKDLYYKDIPIDYHGNSFLHTLIRGEEDLLKPNHNNKKILILLHGYQASSFIFFRIIPLIKNDFIIICPDIIGFGFSSRPKIKFTDAEQTIDFFVESIEKLRQALKIDKFYICGHSLGGYFALNYVLKYPQNVEDKIVLLSPTGIGDPKKGGSCTENLQPGQKFTFIYSLGLVNYFQLTSQKMSKKFLIGNNIKSGEDNKFEISKEENELIGKIRRLHFEYPPDVETCIYYIYKYPIPTPIKPLEDLIIEKIPEKEIIFIFGQNDWMDKFGTERLHKRDENKYKYYLIPNTGHRWPIEKVEEGAKIINDNL